MSNWVVIILGGTGNVFLLCQVGDLGDGNYFLAPDSITAGQAIKKNFGFTKKLIQGQKFN